MSTRYFFSFVFFLILSYASIGQSPDQFNDLSLWLDLQGESIQNVSDDVWLDQSPTATHLTFNKPPEVVTLNSFNAIRFDGDLFAASANESSAFSNDQMTIFVVASDVNSGALISVARNRWSQEFLYLNQSVYQHNNSGNFIFKSHACNESLGSDMAMITGTYSGKTDEINHDINGTTSVRNIQIQGRPSDFISVNRRVTIGQRQAMVPGEWFEGDLYELIIFNRLLDNDEIENVHSYLYCKYFMSLKNCISEGLVDLECKPATTIDCDSVRVAPNPVVDKLNILGEAPIKTVRAFDVVGRVIYDSSVNGVTEVEISTYDWPAAVYFILIEDDCGESTIKVLKHSR